MKMKNEKNEKKNERKPGSDVMAVKCDHSAMNRKGVYVTVKKSDCGVMA